MQAAQWLTSLLVAMFVERWAHCLLFMLPASAFKFFSTDCSAAHTCFLLLTFWAACTCSRALPGLAARCWASCCMLGASGSSVNPKSNHKLLCAAHGSVYVAFELSRRHSAVMSDKPR